MGFESGHKETVKDPIITAQVALALLAAHTEDRKQAMRVWLEGGGDSLATHFREYVESHPDEPLDVHDKNSAEALLEKIRTYH
jgi:hypothetical protein